MSSNTKFTLFVGLLLFPKLDRLSSQDNPINLDIFFIINLSLLKYKQNFQKMYPFHFSRPVDLWEQLSHNKLMLESNKYVNLDK